MTSKTAAARDHLIAAHRHGTISSDKYDKQSIKLGLVACSAVSAARAPRVRASRQWQRLEIRWSLDIVDEERRVRDHCTVVAASLYADRAWTFMSRNVANEVTKRRVISLKA